MRSWIRFADWPVRAGIAATLVMASSVPLIIAAYLDVRDSKTQLLASTAAVLAARGDQLVRELDDFNRAYQRSVDKLAHDPGIVAFCQRDLRTTSPRAPAISATLAVQPARDPNIRGASILDATGIVRIATEPQLVGLDLGSRPFVKEALRDGAVVSDIYLAEPQVGETPTIAYLTPIRSEDHALLGIAVLWVRAAALWNVAQASNGLAGPGSFAVLFDHYGVRVAHTYSDDIVFHPGGRLDRPTLDAFVAERRFGEHTRRLLEDVRAFPEQFDRARSASPDTAMFKGFAPVNQQWNYGIGRRFETVPWTVFYMSPAVNLEATIAQMTREKGFYGGVIVILALGAGLVLAAAILRPLRSLSTATASLASGDLAARVPPYGENELGKLGTSFNVMAGRIEAQATDLRHARDTLEIRVDERTAALKASEERTRLIVETALDAVVTIDAGGLVSGWSPNAEAILGWTATDVVGQSLSETIIPHRYREAHREGMRRYLATGEGPVLNKRIELTAIHRDGREFPIELAITAIHTGTDVSFGAFVRDITDRKRAEDALRSSEARFRTLAESLPQLVWTCAPDGYCDYLSRQWVEYTGRPAEEQLGSGWAEHVHPDDRAFVQQEWAAAAVRGDLFDVEFRIRRFDGVYRWFKTRAVPLRDAEGNIVKWFGSNTDFEYHKQSEARLQSHLERLHLLDETTRAIGERHDLKSIFRVVLARLEDKLPIDFGCVCLYDASAEQLTVTSVGPRSQARSGSLGLAEDTRLPIERNGMSRAVRGQLVYEADLAQLSSPLPRMLAAGGLRSLVLAPLAVESHVFGALLAARHGTEAFGSADCEFLRQLSQHVALAANQAQLYTALQKAYDDLRQSQQGLLQHERLRALGQMASGIAHDVNNALSPAVLYTEALIEEEKGLSEQGRGYLKMIRHAVEDIAQTIGRMTEFYRQREAQIALAPVDVNGLVKQAIELTRARWSDMPQQRGVVVTLRTELDVALPPVLGLESEIREALINLIFNAVDALPDGGMITLRTYRSKDGSASAKLPSQRLVCLDVVDTGLGMDEETRRRCLEPFFTTKGERGTGLGLAMVYGAMQRQGAALDIETMPGRGTTVRLSFPIAGDEAAASGTATLRLRPAPLRILLVDDDPLVIKAMRDILRADGHAVTTADGGQEGIDTFLAAQAPGQAPFAVVITDLGMPYVDGRKVAAAIKTASPSTPVILLTGWGQRLEAEGDTPQSVDHILGKPPKISDLRSVIARLVPPSQA
jgi:PAS domain S-box-containing protein